MREIPRSVEREFRTLDLGDERRVQRAKRLAASFLEAPGASISVACGSGAETKAAYRFLSSDVPAEALRAAQYDAAVERIGSQRRVLAVQDKTSLDFTCCPGTQGLGPLDSPLCRGLKVQTTFLLNEAGGAPGVIHPPGGGRGGEGGEK